MKFQRLPLAAIYFRRSILALLLKKTDIPVVPEPSVVTVGSRVVLISPDPEVVVL